MAALTPDPVPAVSPGPPGQALADPMTSRADRRTMMAQWFIVQAVSAPASREKTVVIRLRGELDVTVRATLEELLAPLPGNQPDRLVIDLAGVSFMDCGTAAIVFEAARQSLPRGRKPVIRAPCLPVRRLLQITGWDQHCVIATSPRRGRQNRPR